MRFSAMYTSQLEAFDRTRTIVVQTKALCREFINSRLVREGFISASAEHGRLTSSGISDDVFVVLLQLGDELEAMCPCVFRDVAKQLNIPVDVETVVSDALFTVAMEISSSGMTWGKVAAIFALAGALAVECVQQGQADVIYAIVDIMGAFACKGLAPWLTQRGGWGDITNCVVKPAPPLLQSYWPSNIMTSWRNLWQLLFIKLVKLW